MQAGTSGSDAQLMSAKTDMYIGVVYQHISHLENVSKTSVSKNKDFKKISILEKR